MRLQIETTDEILAYVRKHSPEEVDTLRELREMTSALPLHLMQVSPEQGNFLKVLVRSLGARRVLEIGVFTGYSLISMAQGVAEGGSVVGLEINDEWAKVAQQYADKADVSDRVDIRVGPALDEMKRMLSEEGLAGTFDLTFIDADKEGYRDYLDLSLELLRPGGSVLVDNVLWHGALIDDSRQDSETSALREFNVYVSSLDNRIVRSTFPYADGMTLLVKP